MAHVFRPTYTKPIPANAEHVKLKGQPAVRWRGRGGKWVVALVSAENPDRCRVEAARYYVEYTDHEGKLRRKKGYQDRAATEALMHELVRQSARIESGLLPPEAARPRRTITELVERYASYIRANGSGPRAPEQMRQRVADVCAGVGAARPSDLTPVAVQGWLAARVAENRHKGYPFGPTTAGNYLTSVKAFTRWLAVVDRSEPYDYLSAVRRKATVTDLRRERRALSPGELDKLISAARRSQVIVLGLSGPERAALYLTACSTGLRAHELSSLAPDSFDLDGARVTIQARKAKNKKTEVLALPDDVVKELRTLLKHRTGVLKHGSTVLKQEGPVWPVRNAQAPSRAWWKHGASMIRHDLKAAGIPFKAGGKQFDLHALRSQFATDLDRAGVDLGRAQKMMRLSSPALLTRHYSKPDEKAIAEDVNKLRKRRR